MLTRTDMSCCYPQDPGSEHSQKSILSGGINDCVHQTTSKTPHGWWMLIVSLQSKSFPGASAWLKLNHIESSMGPSSVIKINCHLQFLQTTLSNKQLGLRLRPTKKNRFQIPFGQDKLETQKVPSVAGDAQGFVAAAPCQKPAARPCTTHSPRVCGGLWLEKSLNVPCLSMGQ